MLKILLLCLGAMSVCCCSSVAASSPPQPAIVVFGDWTTAPREGLIVYGTLLESALRSQGVWVNVINAGVRGNTTDHAAERFHTDVVSHHPDLVVLQFGINDSAVDVWKHPPATQPRVSLEQYGKNLR